MGARSWTASGEGREPAMQRMGRARGGRAGFSLLEITVCLTLVAVLVVAVMRSMAGSMRTLRTNREVALATEAAREQFESMRGWPFEDVWALYNADESDDPEGAGTGFGSNFAVEGLEPPAGGVIGRLEFSDSWSAGGTLELREDVATQRWGTNMDLNLDGTLDAANHSGDYRMLPVSVVVEWEGAAGPSSIELMTILAEFE